MIGSLLFMREADKNVNIMAPRIATITTVMIISISVNPESLRFFLLIIE
jgi:hypothetical protein